MQNRNPSQNNSSQPSILDQAYARARANLTGERPSTETISTPIGNAASTDDRTVDQLLDGAELLRVIREPVEWLLALAHQLAGADPVDVAAIVRLRAAFHARLAGRPTGVRKTDLLVVFGLLVGALDPSVVVHAVPDTIGDRLAAVLDSESPLALPIAGAVDPITSLMELLSALPTQRAGGPRCACSVCSHLVR
jgi:hypothetical protein